MELASGHRKRAAIAVLFARSARAPRRSIAGAMPPHRQIPIETLAPAKPALGAACNGCGVCCLAEPCPLGMLVSRKRQGRCDALRWDAQATRYRCSLVGAGTDWRARLARRWIAAGIGCDSPDDVSAPAPRPPKPPAPPIG